MEYCNEARALKSSVRRELTMQKTQHGFFDDILFMNVMNGDAGSEDFSVDCFFDFVNGEFKEDYIEDEEEEERDSVSISSQERVANDDINTNSRSFSSDSLLTNELAVPDDEIAGLEWVSHFVDDSIPELPLSCSVLKQQSENHAKARFQAEPEPEPVFVKTPCFSSLVPSKTRSKRAKPTGRTWSVGSMPLSESSVSMALSSTSGFSMISTPEPPTKKQKKKRAVQASGLFDGNPFSQRTCSHCHVHKTPQWRTGPLGAKTLCNACGVRYKSGRLFPEYRPACSPTFSVDMHSNSHRKVLEMRQKKALAAGQDLVELIRNMVPSF